MLIDTKKHEFWYYVSVAAGLSLSTSSFLLISGLFEIASLSNIIIGNILSALICVGIASSVGELSSMYPSAGGIRTYIKYGINNKISLIAIFLYILMLILVAGAESYVYALVCHAVFPHVQTLWVVLGVLLFVIFINLLGFEFSKELQMIFTALLVVAVFMVGIIGFVKYFNTPMLDLSDKITFSDFSIIQTVSVIGMGVFLYIGFEWVTPVGYSLMSYSKKIPNSMPVAILLNLIVYTSFIIGIGLIQSKNSITYNSIPQQGYLLVLLGKTGAYVSLAISTLAIISTFNAGLLGGSRFIYALARENKMPKFCTKINLKNSSPYGAILFLGGFSIISALVVNFFEVELFFAVLSSAIVCFVYGLVTLSVPMLRSKLPSRKRSFMSKLPVFIFFLLGVLLPLLGVLSLFSVAEYGIYPIVVLGVLLFPIVVLSIKLDKIELEKKKEINIAKSLAKING